MKILLAPDSFKGALSAADAALAMERGLRRVWLDAEIVRLPIADGGEGTLDTLLAATHGRRMSAQVTGPLGHSLDAAWGLLDKGETAVIELAQAAGLTLIPAAQRDPKITTTRGVGELIRTAISTPGVRRLLIGLGGSGTNDGGAGVLQALGVGLRDAAGDELMVGGAALVGLREVVGKAGFAPIPLEVRIACDVDNPLTGPHGASAIFGPQKGATPADIALLDAAFVHYADVLGIDPGQPGLGAAGGATAGLLYLFPQATLRRGIDLVLDAVGFDRHLPDADLVLTGEGRLDGQTLGGKALAGIGLRARAQGVPVAALVGSVDAGLDLARLASEVGIGAVQTIAPGPISREESMANAAVLLEAAAERVARWISLTQGLRRA